MDIPFAAAAEALHSIVRWERLRIQFTADLAAMGRAAPIDGIDLCGWRERLQRLEALEAMLDILIDGGHEPAVRALDPRLQVALRPQSALPTMWG